MRSDVLDIHKNLHIKISKDAYIALKIEAVKRGLTLQEIFNVLSEQFVNNNQYINKLLDSYSVKKLKNQMAGSVDRQSEIRSDLDSNSIYELIENK